MDNKRTCGECTLCCKTHGIPELNKPPKVYCPHCKINEGCKIYRRRPASCKHFTCLWLFGHGPLRYRPDKVGIVSKFAKIDGVGDVLALFEGEDGALNGEWAKTETRASLAGGIPVVHIPVGDLRWLYLPAGMEPPSHPPMSDDNPLQVILFEEGRF